MRRSTMIAAALGAGLVATSGAQAQVYGGYPPPTPYAGGAYDYARAGRGECGAGFTLAGARAGVTVLGLDIDAGAGLRVGVGGCHEAAQPPPPPPPPEPVYAPRYAPEPESYAPQDAEPQAFAPQYASSPYVEAPPPYASPCGCTPRRYEAPSRYGW